MIQKKRRRDWQMKREVQAYQGSDANDRNAVKHNRLHKTHQLRIQPLLSRALYIKDYTGRRM